MSCCEKSDIFMEQMKENAKTCCCLDWNGAIGRCLAEKMQVVYATMVRMQFITRKKSGELPNVIVVQPLMAAAMRAAGVTDNSFDGPFSNNAPMSPPAKYSDVPYPYYCRAWDTWDVLIDEEAYMEHHIMMTNLVEEKLTEDSKMWCKISLLNMVMQNPFGYFNMSM